MIQADAAGRDFGNRIDARIQQFPKAGRIGDAARKTATDAYNCYGGTVERWRSRIHRHVPLSL